MQRTNILPLLAMFLAGFVGPAHAQQLPTPRILSVMPAGARAGSSVVVAVAGQNLDAPQGLHFSHPGLKSEPISAGAGGKKGAANVLFKVSVAADTPLGNHDLRIITAWGVSAASTFLVGDLLEVIEKEPNNDFPEAQRVELNSTVNGAIAQTTDVDFYVFAGKKGQRVVASCPASSIDSPLVASLELYVANGRRLAANHRYHNTDALVDCVVPADGDYFVRVNQFAYTPIGNVAYPYRFSISTAPWIDAIFSPIIEAGKTAKLTVFGRNLPSGQLEKNAVVQGQILEQLEVKLDVPADALAQQRLIYSGAVTPLMSALDGFEYRLRNGSGSSNPFLLTFAQADTACGCVTSKTVPRSPSNTVHARRAGRTDCA